MSYFAVINGNQEGPFTEDQLRQRYGISVNSDTLVWTEGMADWAPIAVVLPALSSAPVTEASYHTPPPVPENKWSPAPRLSRFLARLIDISPILIISAIMGVVGAMLGATKHGVGASDDMTFIVMGLVLILLILAVLGVQAFMLARFSQTVGKRILGIRIYNFETGAPADWTKTILMRAIVSSLPNFIPLIGYVYAPIDALYIFQPDRRCLHDLIAGTVVGTVPENKPF